MNNKILNLFNNPTNAGRITKPSGIADNSNLDNTANVEFSIKVENNEIVDIKFRAQANPYIIAVCETIAEMAKHKTLDMLIIDDMLVKTALNDDSDTDINFCIDCVKNAVGDYLEKMAKSNKQKA